MKERFTWLFAIGAMIVCWFCVNPSPAMAQTLDIYDVIPSSGFQGDDLTVEVVGNLFQYDMEVIFSNPGIVVNSSTYVSGTSFLADISIDLNSPLGMSDVTVQNVQGQFVTMKDGFEVLDTLQPVLGSLDPTSAMQGTLGISGVLSGTELLQGGVIQFVPSGGPEIVSSVYQSQNSYSLTIDVPEDAIPGFYDLEVTFFSPPWNLSLPSAFEVTEIPTTYDLFIEPNPTVFGYGGQMLQASFLFGVDSNKPDIVNETFNLFATEAMDPVSGNVIGLSNIDIAPGTTSSLLPGIYEQATLVVEVPDGIGEGEYWGTITLSMPGNGEEITTSFTVIVIPTPGEILYPNLGREELEIDLIWPGSPDEGEPEEVLEETPLFEWASSAPFFDFFLFDATAADDDELSGAIQFLEPIYVERDVSTSIMYYPLAAEPLVPGHVYTWYVEAKDIPSFDPIVSDRQPEMIRSEIFFFKYINLDEGTGSPEVMSITVEPGYTEAKIGEMLQFDAVADLLGAGFIDVDWKVVPSSYATIHSNGSTAYVKPLKSGFLSVVAEAGGLTAYAVMKVGDAEEIASIDFDSETLGALEDRLDDASAQLALLTELSGDEIGLCEDVNLALIDVVNDSREFRILLRSAYEMLSPLFLTGKASLSNPHFGDWIEVEFLPAGKTLFVKDQATWDEFRMNRLTDFEDIRRGIADGFTVMLDLGEKFMDCSTEVGNTGSLVLNTSANLEHNLNGIENELADILLYLEVDALPFAPMA